MKTFLTIMVLFCICFSIWYYSSFNNKENMILPDLKLDKLEMKVDSLENRVEIIEKLMENYK